MSIYFIANYNITNSDAYAAYPKLAGPTIRAHGGEVLSADYESETLEGTPGHAAVILRFPSREAALGWYNSDEYQEIIKLRTDNTDGFVVLSKEFQTPGQA